jgi:hypothetical protein
MIASDQTYFYEMQYLGPIQHGQEFFYAARMQFGYLEHEGLMV